MPSIVNKVPRFIRVSGAITAFLLFLALVSMGLSVSLSLMSAANTPVLMAGFILTVALLFMTLMVAYGLYRYVVSCFTPPSSPTPQSN